MSQTNRTKKCPECVRPPASQKQFLYLSFLLPFHFAGGTIWLNGENCTFVFIQFNGDLGVKAVKKDKICINLCSCDAKKRHSANIFGLLRHEKLTPK